MTLRSWKRTAIGFSVLLSATAVLWWSWDSPSLPWPAPTRGVVLVLGPTPMAAGQMPALDSFRSEGREFGQVFAAHAEASLAREASLCGRWHVPADAPYAAVTEALASRSFGVSAFGAVPEHGSGPSASPVSDVPRFLSEYDGKRFLAVVGLSPSLPEEGWHPGASDGLSSELPRIAVADLAFEAHPGGSTRPLAWSEVSRLRASSEHLAACRRADQELGAVLEACRRLAPDATVVYVGDPTPDLGAHGLLDRRDELFDETLRSILVVRGTSLPPRKQPLPGTVSTLGVAATVLDLLGVSEEGRGTEPSLLGRILGRTPEPDAAAVSATRRQAGHIGRSLRTATHRYTEWPDGSLELFDHRTDPGERTNLAGAAVHAPALADLRRRMGQAETVSEPPRPPATSLARRVVLLIIDDLNTEVGAWGAPVQTPNMDRLAGRGVRFSHAYVSVGMCSPSRSTFLLGQRPETTGIWDNDSPARPPGVTPLQDLFHAHGFRTASVGKVYHDPEPFTWDVSEASVADAPGRPEESDSLRQSSDTSLAEPVDGDDLGQPDGQRAMRAARILTEHASERLLLAVGLVRPHRRWIAPRAYFDRYPPAGVQLPVEPPNATATIPAIAIKTRAQWLPGVPLLGREPPGIIADPAFRREAIAAYRACVTFADTQVGRVLEALDRLDLWRDSVVVLVGDNGYHLGDHGGLFRKDTLFEESLHVPLVIVAPGLEPGRVVESPVEMLGLYRTLLDLGGIPVMEATPGRSLTTLLEGASEEGPAQALSYRRVRAPEAGWSIRSGNLRYTLWPDGSEELYEVSRDPGQQRNVAGRPENTEAKARLRSRLSTLLENRAVVGRD